ncbi:MAG: Fe-S cluster assembly protein HesB [Actinomycetia bacterium]|nr:Fe-S cluster assembly protein HesB [Actinomycetes bacterium]
MTDIHFTATPEANSLLGDDAYALLVGLTLYQQVPTEKAFAGPYVLRERLGGTLDAAAIAAMDPDQLDTVFREKPALHRFPSNMAKRVQAVSQFLVDEYAGDPAAVWQGAKNADDLLARLMAIPGFGEYKARLTIGVLAQHYGVKPRGYTKYLPDWPSIVDIKNPEDLAELKIRKKAWKASKA